MNYPLAEPKIKWVIFLARKMGSIDALNFLLQNKIKVKIIVTHPTDPAMSYLKAIARKYHILFFIDDAPLYKMIERKDKRVQEIDLVISYLFWKKIKTPLIVLPKRGCINFHPAPLPDYKGRAGYNTAILDKRNWFGVSAHFIDSEDFDIGPIIKVIKFSLDQEKETAYSLEKKSQIKLLQLFKEVVVDFLLNKKMKLKKNTGGLYLTATQLEELKKIDLQKDSLADIDKKIRAFFFPPYAGAYIKAKGQKFNLINDKILRLIAEIMQKQSL